VCTLELGSSAAFLSSGRGALTTASAGAPLAELAAGNRLVDRSVELLHPKRLAKQLEPVVRGKSYRVVTTRDHNDRKPNLSGVTSKQGATISWRHNIEHNGVNPVVSSQEMPHRRALWRSADAVAAVLKHRGCQFSHRVVIFYDENVLGLGLTHTGSSRAFGPNFYASKLRSKRQVCDMV